MAHTCIRATALKTIIEQRIKHIENKGDFSVAFWSGYQSALEWLNFQILSLGDFHKDEEVS